MKTQTTRSVLIFGGAGFIGSNLAHHLLTTTDAHVHVFDNLSRAGVHHNLEWLKKAAGQSGRLQVTIGDVRDPRAVERAVRMAEEIYHFAAQVAVTTSIADPRMDFEVNLCGTFNVLDAARKCEPKPAIFYASTNKVYGTMQHLELTASERRYISPEHQGTSELQPLDFRTPYGCSKGAADQYAVDFSRLYDLPTVVLRMSCIAGPRQFGTEDQGWIAHFLYSALEQNPLMIYGDGRQVRDILCVQDLVAALEAARANLASTRGQVFNLGGGTSNALSLLELIDRIEVLIGRRPVYVTYEPRPHDQLFYVTDFTRFHRATGWKPAIGIDQTLEMLRAFWEENREMFRHRRAPAPATFAVATQFSGKAG